MTETGPDAFQETQDIKEYERIAAMFTVTYHRQQHLHSVFGHQAMHCNYTLFSSAFNPRVSDPFWTHVGT
jgi:hypothetical protein